MREQYTWWGKIRKMEHTWRGRWRRMLTQSVLVDSWWEIGLGRSRKDDEWWKGEKGMKEKTTAEPAWRRKGNSEIVSEMGPAHINKETGAFWSFCHSDFHSSFSWIKNHRKIRKNHSTNFLNWALLKFASSNCVIVINHHNISNHDIPGKNAHVR